MYLTLLIFCHQVLMLGSLSSAERRGTFQNPASSAPRYMCTQPEAFDLDASSWQELEVTHPHSAFAAKLLDMAKDMLQLTVSHLVCRTKTLTEALRT
jgi:hypothetical protein